MNPTQREPVVLLASSRKGGNTHALAKLVFPDSRSPLVDLAALNISYYSYTHANADDDFIPLVERIITSPVWLLATPLYWYTMSAQAKTFIDRLTDLLSFRRDLGQQLRGKALAVLCSGTDEAAPLAFTESFELSCHYLGMNFLGMHYSQFNGDTPCSTSAQAAAREFGIKLLNESANPSFQRTAYGSR